MALLVVPDVLVKVTTIETSPPRLAYNGFSFGEIATLSLFLVLRVVAIREIQRRSMWGRFLGGALVSLPLYQVLSDVFFGDTSAWTLIHAALLPLCVYLSWVMERSPVGRAYFPQHASVRGSTPTPRS